MENNATPSPAESELLLALAEATARNTATQARLEELGAYLGDKFRAAEVALCQRVREQRVEAGLSQGDVADSMSTFGFDMQQSTVAKIEAGKRSLRVAELFALAAVLNVPVLSLLIDPADGHIEGSVGGSSDALERALAAEELAKRKAEKTMLEQLAVTAQKYAIHDARAVLLSSQIRKNGAAALRSQRTRDNEPPA